MQVVNWESVLKMLNSSVKSFFVEADIFIRVGNFDQSAASRTLTPDVAVT